MIKSLILIGLLLTIGTSLVCSISGYGQQLASAPSTVTVKANGTNFAVTGGAAYTASGGLNYTWTNAVVGTNIMGLTWSGWPKNDNTVMQISIKSSQLSNVTIAATSNADTNAQVLQYSSALSSWYLGFKAVYGSVALDFTPNATSGTLVYQIRQYGWNNGLTCQTMCNKTLYRYADPLTNTPVPGQYDCFGNNLIISAILIIFALLF